MDAYNSKRNRDITNQKYASLASQQQQEDPTNPNQNSNSQNPNDPKGLSQVKEMQHLGNSGEAAFIRKIKKRDLHSYLKCPLCTGFFRDAHTINECLDTFCKSCIYKYFYEDQNKENCPKCNIHLGDLLYPQFKKKDEQAIKMMYQAFASTDPLPKDRNLIDYGFEDYDLTAINDNIDLQNQNEDQQKVEKQSQNQSQILSQQSVGAGNIAQASSQKSVNEAKQIGSQQ